ncbi:MAG: B12-binding domain-containing radical SAM protein [Deltaproteobacteria bacterium]|nr:B12-binding domain-containing radical SAM protein [Deltaproteobacteria bacterium]
MYVASYVRKIRRDEVRIFDIRFYKDPINEIRRIMREFCPDTIGISALTLEAPAMYQIARFVKTITDVPVIVGGPHATSAPETVLQNKDIDIVVIGEGEITFKELLDNLDKGQGIDKVLGIGYRRGNEIILTSQREYVDNLDKLPFPSWDLIDINRYAHTKSMSTPFFRSSFLPYMVMLTSRGCPFLCTYCHNIFGKKFRARSVENVLQEMAVLIEKYHISDFEIIDDISNFDRERIKSICSGIIKGGWKIRFSFPNGVRTDMLDEEIVSLMRRAGAGEMSIAVETVSPRLQKMIKKNLNLEKVRHMINFAADEGIFLRGFFMMGFPTETEEEIKATIDFACNSRLHTALFFMVNMFKGTEIYKQAQDTGVEIPELNLEDFDYHAMPFNVSAVSDKRLHRLYSGAYVRFYLNPVRVFRILKTKAVLRNLFYNLTHFLPTITSTLLTVLFPLKGNKHTELGRGDNADTSKTTQYPPFKSSKNKPVGLR